MDSLLTSVLCAKCGKVRLAEEVSESSLFGEHDDACNVYGETLLVVNKYIVTNAHSTFVSLTDVVSCVCAKATFYPCTCRYQFVLLWWSSSFRHCNCRETNQGVQSANQ